MKNSPGVFNVAASEAYRRLGDDEKKLLDDSTVGDSVKTMSIKNIKREGAKLFHTIELQVSFLRFWLQHD